MGVFRRVDRLLRANIHEALERTENPATILSFLILEMQESLEQVRGETETAIAAERRLAQQATHAALAAEGWERRARLAVDIGDDELAREALRRAWAATSWAMQYQQAHREQVTLVTELRESLERLQERLHEAKSRRMLVTAKLSAMHPHHVVARTTKQTLSEEAFQTFDLIAAQARSDRHHALTVSELLRDDMNDTFIEAGDCETIEHKLACLKHDVESSRAANGHGSHISLP